MNKSTITREQAQKIIVAADEVITALAGTNEDVHPDDSKKMCELWDDLNDRCAPPVVVRELARMALAAMDSEPVAWTEKCEITNMQATGLYLRGFPDNSHGRDIPLYRHAQPAPVVPNERDKTVDADDHPLTWSFNEGWNACRAAMLQDEPVTTANKLPETQFKQVADLYEMQFDDGRTCAFHTDAEKAVQWLNTCDGNKVQEYVKLERLHDAVSANSPVIPDTWIPVSERLPEFGDYLVTDGCDFDVQLFNGEEFIPGFVWEDKITHWMPLPKPPQEVKP